MRLLQVGEFVVEVKAGQLRFLQGDTLIFAREIATRCSRGVA